MGLVTPDQLKQLFAREPVAAFRIDGPVDSADSRYLGQVGLHNRDPVFRFGYWIGLSDSARFYLIELQSEEAGINGVGIVFRQFDSSPYSADPSEYFAGWVPAERAGDAAAWAADMNARLVDLLAVKHVAKKTPRPACPSCGSAEYRPEPPASRELDAGEVYLSVPMRCPSCGHRDALVFALDMEPAGLGR